MNRYLIGFLALLALLPCVLASGGVSIEQPSQQFFLEEQTSIAAVFSVANNSNHKVCFDADAFADPDQLETIVASNHFCLNPNERTTLTLTMIAREGIATGSYPVTLQIVHDGITDTLTITANVEQSPSIVVSASPKSQYCHTEQIDIPITIQNNSGSTQTVDLEPDSTGFAPNLEKSHFILSAGQSRETGLTIFTGLTAPIGTFTYSITSRTASQASVQKFSFKVIQCGEEPPHTQSAFKLILPDDCVRISPGEEKNASFTLENTGNVPLNIWFSASNNSGLELELDSNRQVHLEPGEEANPEFLIKAHSGIEEKMHTVQVTAGTLAIQQSGSICVIVRQPFSLDLVPNNVTVERGQDFSVALTLKNNWNTSQTVTLSVTQDDDQVNVSFSRRSVSLKAYEEKTVIAAIETDSDISLGGHLIEFRAKNSNGEQKAKLFFSAIPVSPEPPQPPQPLETGVLKLVSYPTFLDLNSNANEEVVFVVLNDGNDNLSNIQVLFEGLPQEVQFIAPPSFGLAAHQTITVRGLIRTNGTVSNPVDTTVALVVRNNRFQDTQRVQLHVGTEQAKASGFWHNLISGMFSFGSGSFWLGLAVLVILVGWLLWGTNRFWLVLLVILLILAWFLLASHPIWFALLLAATVLAWLVWGKNHAWVLFIALVLVVFWFLFKGNPFWFTLAVVVLALLWLLIAWSRDHYTYRQHKEAWKQVSQLRENQ